MKSLMSFIYLVILNTTLIPKSDLTWATALTPNYDLLFIVGIVLFLPSLTIMISIICSINYFLNLTDLALLYFLNKNLYLGLDYRLIVDLNNFGTMSYGFSFYLIYLLLLLAFVIFIQGIMTLLKKISHHFKLQKKFYPLVLIVGIPICHEVHHKIQANKSFIFRNIKKSVVSFDNKDSLLAFQREINDSIARFTSIDYNVQFNKPNIYIFFIESYGLSTLRIDKNVSNFLQNLPQELNNRHQKYFSGILESPVFGGQSWMAYASLNCGLHVDNQLKFKSIFRSQVKCLPEILKNYGYFSIEIKPGTKQPLLKEEIEKYKFDKSIIAKDLDYHSIPIGWGAIPDEYSLARFFLDLLPSFPKKPKLIEFFLVSSHTPWEYEIPILGIEKKLINDFGRSYNSIELKKIEDTDLAYTRSILYDLKLIKTVIQKFTTRDDIIIILGDHPPNNIVSNFYNLNLVPIHVITPHWIGGFEEFLSHGLIPDTEKDIIQMKDFSERFLRTLFKKKLL